MMVVKEDWMSCPGCGKQAQVAVLDDGPGKMRRYGAQASCVSCHTMGQVARGLRNDIDSLISRAFSMFEKQHRSQQGLV